jgi:hypothetical protein
VRGKANLFSCSLTWRHTGSEMTGRKIHIKVGKCFEIEQA